ncbi:MAG: cupin domain-containing protein [Myxococcales bacterium]|nr:cupin domain-containing protein [Myxococcales bacterium]
MSTTLSLFHVSEPAAPYSVIRDRDRITETLSALGIRFELWSASRVLAAGATPADVLAAYAGPVARLTEERGYQSVDVVRMGPDHPDRVALRAKFLAEHVHDDDEARFFVEGAGAFYVRTPDHVYQVDAHAGDLIILPKETTHWFDAGERPRFAAIRLFTAPDGWIARYTGDPIASQFPAYPGEPLAD